MGYAHEPLISVASPTDFTGASNFGSLGPFTIETAQRFMYGTRQITWDGKVYRYSKTGAVCRTGRGAKCLDKIGTVGIDYVILPSANAIGASTMVMTSAIALAADALAGGTMIVSDEDDDSPTDGRVQQRTIMANTACGAGATTTITLDYPLNRATTIATYAFCMPSPYDNVGHAETETSSVLGLPAVYASASGYFIWIQTWGLCWIAPQADDVGKVNSARQVVFRHDGSLDIHDYANAYEGKQQHAGFTVDENTGANGGTIFMLQISV